MSARGQAAGAPPPELCWEDWSPTEDDLALLLSPPHSEVRTAACTHEHEQAPAPAPPRPAKKARRSTERLGSPYRGVSFHGRTGRCEAHIWISGAQVYLGSFFCAEAAAAAYDLAAVRARGALAATNFPLHLYAAELAAGEQVALDALVQQLRTQAKALARPDAAQGGRATRLEPWERGLSEAISGQRSLGVFTSEAEAARAADVALLARDGLAATPNLNFPLGDYAPQLGPALLAAATQQGLLPAAGLPAQPPPPRDANQSEAGAVQPGMLQGAEDPAAALWAGCDDGLWWSGGQEQPGMAADGVLPALTCQWREAPCGAASPPASPAARGDDEMAPLLPQPVARKASMTPRPGPWG